MRKPLLTDWIDPSIKPTIIGWYEREYSLDWLVAERDYWDGEQFITQRDGVFEGPAKLSLRWRGLAEDPNRSTHKAEALGDKGKDKA